MKVIAHQLSNNPASDMLRIYAAPKGLENEALCDIDGEDFYNWVLDAKQQQRVDQNPEEFHFNVKVNDLRIYCKRWLS